jgi:hypothetical protein
MEFIKKNVSMIVFGVIAIIAVAAAFYPMGGYFDKLREDTATRSKKLEDAKRLVTKQRELPEIKLTSEGQRTPLSVFPSEKITQIAKRFMSGLTSESKGVLDIAVQINQAECGVGDKGEVLLEPGSLGAPSEIRPNADNRFKLALPGEYDAVVKKVLDGATPPTQDDMTKATAELQAKHDKNRVIGPDNQVVNEAQIQEAFQKDAALLPERVRAEVAAKHKMYVDVDAIAQPKQLETAAISPTPQDIWFAQATLWVEEDVCRAISEMNKSAKNALDAPVKRLVSLVVPWGPAMYMSPVVDPTATSGGGGERERGGGSAAASLVGAGGVVANNEDPKTPPLYSLSPTGRANNKLYDVVAFSLTVHIDQTKIPAFIKQLSTNRFITVRKMELRRVDNKAMLEQGYVYGATPMAEIVLDCEALQLREWTVKLMPKIVKDMLLGPGVEYTFQLDKNNEKKAG